jgi:hypothetical protein
MKDWCGAVSAYPLGGLPGGLCESLHVAFRCAKASTMQDVDFYVLEHRGVGESARLACPQFEVPPDS